MVTHNDLTRHDISYMSWAIIEPLLPDKKGDWCDIAKYNRQFINGVFCILRTGGALARTAFFLWSLEKYSQKILPLERQRDMGKNIVVSRK